MLQEKNGKFIKSKKEKIVICFLVFFMLFNILVFLRFPYYVGSFLDLFVFDTLLGFSRYFFYIYYILISFSYLLKKNRKFFYFLTRKRTFVLLSLFSCVACLIETIVYYHVNIEPLSTDLNFSNFFVDIYTKVWDELISGAALWQINVLSVPGFFWFFIFVIIKKYPIFIFYFLVVFIFLLTIFMAGFRNLSAKFSLFFKKFFNKTIELLSFYWIINLVNENKKKKEISNKLPTLDYKPKNNLTKIADEGKHSLKSNDFVFKSSLLPYSYKLQKFDQYQNYKLDVFNNGAYDTYELQNSLTREKNRKETLKIINNLGSFFISNQIEALFLDKEIGPSVIRLRFSFLDKSQLNSILETKNELETIFGTSNFEIYLRDDQLIFEFPASVREKFDLHKMIVNMNYDFPLAVPAGFDINYFLVQFSLSKNPVFLIVGDNKNSGKDNFVNQILISLIIKNSPNNLRFVILSNSNNPTYDLYKDIDHLMNKITNNWSDIKSCMERILVEMKYRIKLLHTNDLFSIEDYNKTASIPLPRIVVVLDDFSEVLNCDSEFIYHFISAVKKHGQLLNISLILVGKEVTNEMVNVSFIDLYFNLICFRLNSSNESKMLLNKQILNKLYNHGDFYYISDLKTFKLIRGQAANVTDDDVKFIVNQVKKAKK